MIRRASVASGKDKSHLTYLLLPPSTEQQNNPPAKGKEVAVDDGILGGLKDILFGTTGPRGGKKDGVVQTMAKSAALQLLLNQPVAVNEKIVTE